MREREKERDSEAPSIVKEIVLRDEFQRFCGGVERVSRSMRSDGTDQINKISEVPCCDVEREKWLLFLGRYTKRARITSVCFVSGLRGSFRARTSAQSAGRDASRQAAIRKERRRTTSELKAAENKERGNRESRVWPFSAARMSYSDPDRTDRARNWPSIFGYHVIFVR